MKEWDYGTYIEDIIEHMNYAEDFIKNLTFEEFAKDKKTILSVTKCIQVVGEATKHIPDAIRDKYPEIPWRDLAGIRDRLVHGYFKVNPRPFLGFNLWSNRIFQLFKCYW